MLVPILNNQGICECLLGSDSSLDSFSNGILTRCCTGYQFCGEKSGSNEKADCMYKKSATNIEKAGAMSEYNFICLKHDLTSLASVTMSVYGYMMHKLQILLMRDLKVLP